jgi:hypothetical protein
MPITANRKRGALALACVLALAVPTILAAQDPAASAPVSTTSAPYSVHDNFNYRVLQTFGLRGLGGPAISGLISQANDVPHEWGQGMEGYGKRFGSAFGNNLTRQTMAFVLETALHEDSRYFPSKEKGFGARLKNVLVQTVVTRTNTGTHRFAYSRVVSAYAAGQLTNAWQPRSNGTVGDGLIRGTFSLGGDCAFNFLQEFIPRLLPKSLRH